MGPRSKACLTSSGLAGKCQLRACFCRPRAKLLASHSPEHPRAPRTTGVFNACGPEKRLAWGSLVAACQKAGSSASKPVWIPAEFVAQQKDLEFPIWVAYQGESKGFHTWRNDRAVKAGLRFRPAEQTAKDTLAWFKTQEKVEKGRNKLAGPSVEQEAKLIAAWREASKAKS